LSKGWAQNPNIAATLSPWTIPWFLKDTCEYNWLDNQPMDMSYYTMFNVVSDELFANPSDKDLEDSI